MMFKSFGELLRTTRKEQKISLRKLEELTEVSFSHLSKIERGEYKPSRETVEIISEALELDEDVCMISAGYAPRELMESEIKKNTTLKPQSSDESLFFFDQENITEEEKEALKEHLEFLRYQAAKKNKEQK